MEEYECDCGGPGPPPFRLPPPPRPPFLHEIPDCSPNSILDLDTCNTVPVIDAEYHSSPALPSLAVIVVCSLILLAILIIGTALAWKHKQKMQNFLPCKSSPQNHCDVAHGNGVIYEDLSNMRPRPRPQPSMEMLDVKARGVEITYHSPVFIYRPPSHQYSSQDLYNPVYEELSNGSGERGDSEGESDCVEGGLSEDEFAEDELSLGGSRPSPEHLYKYPVPKPNPRPRSRRNPPRRTRHKAEFHEGLLVEALLRPPGQRPPYILPLPGEHYSGSQPRPEFTTFRPSQDSDSGYSHHTSGGRAPSRGHRPHRIVLS